MNHQLHEATASADGRLHLPVMNSPEYPLPALGGDTNYQLALTKWGLKTAIRICALLGCEDPKQAEFASALTVRARPGRLSALSVSRCESVLHGAFVWARGALDGRKGPALRYMW